MVKMVNKEQKVTTESHNYIDVGTIEQLNICDTIPAREIISLRSKLSNIKEENQDFLTNSDPTNKNKILRSKKAIYFARTHSSEITAEYIGIKNGKAIVLKDILNDRRKITPTSNKSFSIMNLAYWKAHSLILEEYIQRKKLRLIENAYLEVNMTKLLLNKTMSLGIIFCYEPEIKNRYYYEFTIKRSDK